MEVENLKKNEVSIGVMLSEIPFANLAVVFKSSGLDFFIVDTEHGAFDYAALSGIIMTSRLVKIPVIIRLANNGRKEITRLMDMGADGLLLSMANNRQDVETVIQHAKYSPLGKRGISITRPHTFYAPPSLTEYMSSANKRTLIFAQIETLEGLNNIEDILQAEGLSGVIVGPNDLSCDLNCIGNTDLILRAIEKVAESAHNCNKLSGIITAKKSICSRLKNIKWRFSAPVVSFLCSRRHVQIL